MNDLEQVLFDNKISFDNIIMVEPGNYAITNSSKSVIATDDTYSCTNILIYSEYFAYLTHLFPSETIGRKNTLFERIDFLKLILGDVFKNLVSDINVLVCMGISSDKEKKLKHHDLSFVDKKLEELKEFCEQNNIKYNRLPNMVSKFLIFNCEDKKLFIDNGLVINEGKKINRM